MGDLIARATQGIDLTAPGAFWQVCVRLLELVPWWQLLWFNVLWLTGGALLGWWRGRIGEGVAWAALLGPIGWAVIVVRGRRPKSSARQ